MVAFIKDGMDIPDHLVHAQENGRVVFFCGAGISMAAGLPDYKGLLKKVYSALHEKADSIESDFCKKEQYDQAFKHLETRLVGGHKRVRKEIMQILQPKRYARGATETHKALLQLSTDREGITRLVTTNFDRLFEKAIKQKKMSVPSFAAPNMPEANSGQWHGLVYLHGLLPESYDESALERLVFGTQGFGAAYLTEQWAANFVKALLQNYIVCFVGYSLNDPLLQYLVTASLSGKSQHNAYALASLDDDKQEEEEYDQWDSKEVIPVFYKPGEKHAPLHHTLKAWAEIYSAQSEGKTKIITEHASVAPPSSCRSDYAVGRVLWALADPLAAKHFCEMKPVPPLKWLEPLLENSFDRDDLPLFGVTAEKTGEAGKKFAFLRRPTPTSLAPFMRVFNTSADFQQAARDAVMRHLADWICRHLGDPNLIHRIIENGYQLHDNLMSAIGWRMRTIEMLESKNSQEELARLADGSPHAIPRKNMRVIWRLILSGKITLSPAERGFYSFLNRVKKNGWTSMSRLEMCKMLAPRVQIDLPFSIKAGILPGVWSSEKNTDDNASSLSMEEIADCQVVLACSSIHYSLADHATTEAWKNALPGLLPDFTALLRDALDLMQIVAQASDSADMSVYDQVSISPNPQNRKSHEWTALIDLSREAWIATSQSNPEKARNVAAQWMYEQYPLFKRLAFFAATYDKVISNEQALNWLLSENHKWLWRLATRREALRLIVARAPQLPKNLLRELEAAIVSGPPRDIFPADLDSSKFNEAAESMTLFRLAKLQASGVVIGRRTASELKKLQAKYPDFQIREDGQDELYLRIESGPEVMEELQGPPLPAQRHELVDWVKNHHELNPGPGNRWRVYCRDEFSNALSVLQELVTQNEWPVQAWWDALDTWGMEDDLLKDTFVPVSGILANASNEVMRSLSAPIVIWMRRVAEKVENADENILAISNRIISVQHKQDEEYGDEIIVSAYHHPVGGVVEALLVLFYPHTKNNAKNAIANILEIFSKICNPQIDQFRHGRVVLAEHATDLHYHESEWTKKHLFPLFDWDQSEQEAQAVWIGWLHRFRFHKPFILELKDAILQTAKNCDKLGPDHTDNYADLLTLATLDSPGIFSGDDGVSAEEKLRDATAELPPKALERVTYHLYYRLYRADENPSDCWENQVRPYLEYIWPKSEGDRKTPEVSKDLAKICIATEKHFPDALEIIGDWLQPLDHAYSVLRDLHEKNLCKDFPEESLEFLSRIVDKNFYSRANFGKDLQICLDGIKRTVPALENDSRFQRLQRIASAG